MSISTESESPDSEQSGVSGERAERKRRTFGGNADFLKLWVAQAVTLFGSEVTLLAIPLTAALTLGAGELEMGFLFAAAQVPFLLLSLFVGVWIDHVARRPVLIAADVGRALLLLTVPLAVLAGVLSMPQLYVVAFVMGALEVLFEVAHYAYVPSLVGRDELVRFNSKLQISHSSSSAAGPGVAGVLIQVATAPLAIVADSLSYLVSALLIWRIRTPEPPLPKPSKGQKLWPQIAEGLRALLNHPLLRPIIISSVHSHFFLSAIFALYILYAIRELALPPLVLGFVFAARGLAAVPGALIARALGERFGVGPVIIGGWLISFALYMLVPVAALAGPWAAVVLGLTGALAEFVGTVANIHQWTLRQATTPTHLQGRVTASHRFLVYGSGSLGALAGGLVASVLGLGWTLFLCAVGATVAVAWVYFSPLRHYHGNGEPDEQLMDLTGSPDDASQRGDLPLS